MSIDKACFLGEGNLATGAPTGIDSCDRRAIAQPTAGQVGGLLLRATAPSQMRLVAAGPSTQPWRGLERRCEKEKRHAAKTIPVSAERF